MLWILFAVLLLIVTAPATIELLLLTVGAILSLFSKKQEPPAEPSKKIAILIPAYNEEFGISRTIDSLKMCRGVFDLIVIADNCTDKTAAIAQSCGTRVLTRSDPLHVGKNHALKFAFDNLLEENYAIFLVIDADTVCSPNLIEEIEREFRNGVDGIQVFYGVLNANDSLYLRLMKISYLGSNLLRPLGRQFWGFSSGILGNGAAFSRKTIQETPFSIDSVVEDLAYHIQLVRAGKSLKFTDKACVLAEMPRLKEGITSQRLRWEGGRLRTAIKEIPSLLHLTCQGNWRLAEPLLDLLTLPLTYHILALLLLVLLPLPWAKAYAGFGLCVVAFHVLAAIQIGKGSVKDYLILLIAPFYVLWKVLIAGKIFRIAVKGTAWIRTQRNGD
jgi:cellulose synthase/poly-beta-1,6-N-acetylglucosamine synthase-like glycosyltransferase